MGILLISIILSLFIFKGKIARIIDDHKVVLEVNGEQVTKREYKIRFNTLKENAIQFSSRADILDQVFNGKTYRELLKDELFTILTEELLCLQDARRRNIYLTKQEEEEIKKYIEELKANEEMRSYFNQYLRKIGSDENHFYRDLHKTRIINKLYSSITSKTTVSDSEIVNYYNTNKNQFKKIKIMDIFLKVENEEEDVQKREIANKIVSELKKGEDFEKLVKKYTEDESVGITKGIIDYFRKGEKEAEYGSVFEEEVFKLAVGQVSNIIKTIKGYHIVKVLDEKYMPLDEVKGEIQSKLMKQKKDQVFRLYIENLKKSSKINVYKDRTKDL
ncbi:PpiC-type peptidyl-prolyl cis-trans isomerase [Caldicellulosiruptor obsidiansis OB47]|uniref:PpiC-type peptidyl-prolyl cis-trans isomerase n=1 Tax=Caldicellulosiruptor obsidiansis (strain ATCC BAA-2073 / JCM 16842 / OB47) TaxID=608506 RepID=D9TFH6_CALOO|nr:peptidylprolyl isomerase [Caldicellulosiruptor obsidiansis]ADL42946.1 PpiC-type peptidyl-prolyl cis-trans isomerase [Caldicellulosiruptor obsidiansis OB47]